MVLMENNVISISDQHNIIADGLSEFMENNGLDLSDQNFSRACRHLEVALQDYDKITAFAVNNCLQNMFEYKEGVIEAMDKDGLSEEALMSIIIAADKKTDHPDYRPPRLALSVRIKLIVRRFFRLPLLSKAALIVLFAAVIAAPFVVHQYVSKNEIGISAAVELKDMVAKVVVLENAAGNNVNAAAVWSDIKARDSIVKYGYKSSYHNFNSAQYAQAKKYLHRRIKTLEGKNDKALDKNL